jgi:hypothetical protein
MSRRVPATLADTGPAAPAAPRRDRTAARTRTRHADVHRMLAAGHTVLAIAAELGLARNTVRRFARAADPEELLVCDGTGRRTSIIAGAHYHQGRWSFPGGDRAIEDTTSGATFRPILD